MTTSNSIVYDKNYMQRLEQSLAGVTIGVFLFTISLIFLWLLEKHALKFMLLMERCFKATRLINNTSIIDPAYESQSVLVQGVTNANNTMVEDPVTGFRTADTFAIRLKRKVRNLK